MNRVVTTFDNHIFHFLEDSCLLNSHSEFDLFALHYICLPKINASLEQFVEQWHFMRYALQDISAQGLCGMQVFCTV